MNKWKLNLTIKVEGAKQFGKFVEATDVYLKKLLRAKIRYEFAVIEAPKQEAEMGE